MKLNSREKILLLFLAFIGLMAAYYYLLLNPQLIALETISATAEQYKQSVETMKAQMDPNHPIFAEYKTKQSELSQKTASYYPAIIQEKLITVLDAKLKAAGVNPDSAAFSITEKSLPAQAVAPQGDQAQRPAIDLAGLRNNFIVIENGSAADSSILRNHELTAALNIKTDYAKLMSFIAALEKDQYKILVNNLSMNSGEGSEITCNLSVSFVAVPKLFEEGDVEYLKWTLASGSNKYNPFIATANLNPGEAAPVPVVETPTPAPTPAPTPKPTTPTTPTTQAPTPPAPSKNSDFAITLRPISSDIPTVLVGKVNDKVAGSYAYADNPEFEDVEIQILEKDGKLYYRYKTSSSSHPANYSDMTEFTPKTANVIIEVLSTKRTGAEDKSGINLTIVNKSSKGVTVSIKSDDTTRSRVKLASYSGSVTVKR